MSHSRPHTAVFIIGILGIVAYGQQLGATVVRVKVGSPLQEGVPVQIQAVPEDPSASLMEGSIVLGDPAKDELFLDLTGSGSWKLTVEAQGYWAPTYEVQVSDNEIDVPIYPTGTIDVSVKVEPGEALPQEVAVDFAGTAKSAAETFQTMPRGTVECSVEKGKASCEIPSGTLDLRLKAPHFVPRYLWAVDIPRASYVDLGTFHLKKGASVAGWVLPADEPIPQPPTTVGLSQRVPGWHGDPRTGQAAHATTFRTVVSQRGFFQLGGLPPGNYLLAVKREGFSPHEVYPITLDRALDFVLDEEISLHRLSTLSVQLEPEIDPYGKPWVVTLLASLPSTRVYETKATAAAELDGRWEVEGIESGEYRLTIHDGRGSQWKEHVIAVREGDETEFLQLPVIPLRGHVRRGNEPLELGVVFGTTQGTARISLSSDQDGFFTGYLPREGTWEVELVPPGRQVVAMAVSPRLIELNPVHGAAVVDIDVPDTRLSGIVVSGLDETGVPGCYLAIVHRNSGRREAVLRASDDGTFEVLGIEPGPLYVRAYRSGLDSGWIEVDLLDGLDSDLRLVLDKKVDLIGRVMAGETPVSGARVRARPRVSGTVSAAAVEATTDVEGRFSLSIPETSLGVELLVVPPGFAFAVYDVSLPRGPGRALDLQVVPSSGTVRLRPDSSSVLVWNGWEVAVPTLVGLLRPSGRALDVEGAIDIQQMPVGEYHLCGEAGATKDSCEKGLLVPGSQLVLTPPWQGKR